MAPGFWFDHEKSTTVRIKPPIIASSFFSPGHFDQSECHFERWRNLKAFPEKRLLVSALLCIAKTMKSKFSEGKL